MVKYTILDEKIILEINLFDIQKPKKTFKYSDIKKFVKTHRKNLNLTQQELADKAGVELRFLRELEQGKEGCRIDKVLQVLKMFGYTLVAVNEKELSN